MNFELSDEQRMLAEQARSLFSERSTPDRLRALIGAGDEWDEPLWRQLAQVGFLGAAIPEADGGLGLGALDLGIIAEEIGRANAAVPFLSSIVLAADAIAAMGDADQRARWLPGIAAGTCVAALAYSEERAGFTQPALRYADGRLSGTKIPVADAGVASLLLVTACDEAGACVIVAVDPAARGVERERLESFDQLRPHYRIDFHDAPAERLAGSASPGALARLFDRAAIVAAFEAVGGAQACLDMALAYAAERRIFGRPLASYQAIKHKLADIAVQVELARSNAWFGAWAADNAPAELPAAAACARLTAIGAFERAARENLQVHGGIGYTFEGNCHFYYRRERLHALILGQRPYWAARLIAHRAAPQPGVA
ncbi:acyl-CoA dehydrogenase [Sphingopyxis lindanitolerans]|uniref:Acyl-CoA dehydrogenase n=1 Tax=Sphingopyxis lindanitolerans TaxID=2054227 RepID=A0A2S8B5Y3_9SPHN|nr:acyl-CoA dehydrogenase family protein [Sphingopyxis lindanitolerans]PQM27750.1 acyl-CoA dehydrogenase [Sphingopyxis lindanitolerans]